MNSADEYLNDEFATELIAAVTGDMDYPRAFYNKDGDCIEFLLSNESFRCERVDKMLTVYYGRDSGEIVGSLVKGVRRFIGEMLKSSPGFAIEVEDEQMKLAHLFTAEMWTRGEQVTVRKYYKALRDTAERHQVRVHVPCPDA